MIGKRIDGSSAGQLRCRHLRRRLDWSPWLGWVPCSISDRHVRMRAFININSDLYQDHGGIIHGARGLNVNIALERPCCFSEQQSCIRCHHLLERRFDDPLRGIESTTTMQNFVESRWRNLRQSMIYRSPVKSGWESRRV